MPVSKHIKQQGCLVYDENERPMEYESIKDNVQFIPLVHVEGIKFSSKSFQIDINIRQVMILSLEDTIKKSCLIKNTIISDNTKDENLVKSLNVVDNVDNVEKVDITDNVDNQDNTDNTDNADNIKKQNNLDNLVDGDLENSKTSSLETLDKISDNSLKLEESESLEKESEELELDDNNLHEFNLDLETINNDDQISLKNPSEVYYEIYKTAYDKAKRIKQAAIEAHLEAKKIKLKYNLDEMLNSDDELSNFSDFDG